MDIGLALPHYEYSLGLPGTVEVHRIIEIAQLAEGLGFDSLWVSDHLSLDLAKYGGPSDPFSTPELFVLLSALAQATSRARIGSLVALEALRPAGVLAKAAATVDQLSCGRLTVGLGAGWYEPDYRELGIAMPTPGQRVARLVEALEVVGALFRSAPGERVTAGGSVHSVHEALLTPRGYDDRTIPLLVGGKGDRVIDTAVRHANEWNTCWVWTPDAYAERRDVFLRSCDRHQIDPTTRRQSLGLYTLIGENEQDLERRYTRLQSSIPGVLDEVSLEQWREGRLVGTPEQVMEQLEVWNGLGVAEIIIGLGSVPFHLAHPEDLEYAASVLRSA